MVEMPNKRHQTSGRPGLLKMAPRWGCILGSILLIIVLSQYFRVSYTAPPVPKNLSTLDSALIKRITDSVTAIQSNPNVPDLWGLLGIVYEAHDYNSLSMQCYETANKLAPSNPRWIYHIALLSIKKGNVKEAEVSLRQVILLKPNYAPAHERLGILLLDANDLEAKLHFQRVLQLRPNEPQGYIGLARIQMSLKEYSSAIELFSEAITLSPNNKTAHFLLGRVYQMVNREEEMNREFALGGQAEQTFLNDLWHKEVTQAGVTYAAKLENATNLLSLGQVDQAVVILEQLLEVVPNDLAVVNNIAIAYIRTARLDDAYHLLSKAVKVNPDHFPSYINLASVLLSKKELTSALENAEIAIRIATMNHAGFQVKGVILSEMGRHEESLASLQHAQRLHPQNPAIYGFIAETLVKLQRWDEALQAFEKATELNPPSASVYFKMGAIYSQNDRLPEAINALNKALRLEPDNPGILRALERVKKLNENQ